eukprot:4476105-Pyramimonas_sp.AAC.1
MGDEEGRRRVRRRRGRRRQKEEDGGLADDGYDEDDCRGLEIGRPTSINATKGMHQISMSNE